MYTYVMYVVCNNRLADSFKTTAAVTTWMLIITSGKHYRDLGMAGTKEDNCDRNELIVTPA